jgi:transposase
MTYAGLVPSESFSGKSVFRGTITKIGNAYLRRVLFEAAFGCRHPPFGTPSPAPILLLDRATEEQEPPGT